QCRPDPVPGPIALHATPAAISQRIKALEDQLQTAQVDRESRESRLTPMASTYSDTPREWLRPHGGCRNSNRRLVEPLCMLTAWRDEATEQIIYRFERRGLPPRELIRDLLTLPFRG